MIQIWDLAPVKPRLHGIQPYSIKWRCVDGPVEKKTSKRSNTSLSTPPCTTLPGQTRYSLCIIVYRGETPRICCGVDILFSHLFNPARFQTNELSQHKSLCKSPGRQKVSRGPHLMTERLPFLGCMKSTRWLWLIVIFFGSIMPPQLSPSGG